MPPPEHLTPDAFLLRMFSTRPARSGGVIRRAKRDVDRIVGPERFRTELRRRGYRAVENGGQYVIFCNREPVISVL